MKMPNAKPQWPVLDQTRHREELMDAMMETTGVDVLKVISAENGAAFMRARANCRACRSEVACRLWLADTFEEVRSPPEFCPNANFFRLF